jgi:hypothetical protein
MAFTTLEERFNQISQQIYNRYSPSGDQYVSIKPDTNGVFGSNSRIKNDSRSVPTVSTARDVRRVTTFWNSAEGRLFIGKQLLLQTGNTFAETRLYNPLNIILTAVPFIGTGITRHIGKPLGVKTLKTPTRDLRGALQQETLDKFSTDTTQQGGLARLGSQLRTAVISPFKAYNYEPKRTSYFSGDSAKEFYLRPEDSFYTFPIRLEATVAGNDVAYSHNGSFGSQLFRVQPVAERGNVKNTRNTQSTFVGQVKLFAKTKSKTGNKTFKQLENTLNTNGYFFGKPLDVLNISSNVDNVLLVSASGEFVGNRVIPYPTVNDPYNGQLGQGLEVTAVNGNRSADQRDAAAGTSPAPQIYSTIMGDPKQSSTLYVGDTKTDIIKFIFRTNEANANPVHFRAFLSSLKENVKPDFNEQRYIGRTERFVTYGGAKRTANFEFNIVAFAQSEIQQVWRRINYLTGLAFPIKPSESGFMVPPMFKITIGGIYDDQPCYIDTLDYDFLDNTITFDIDKEVSQVVNVKMNIVLLEKRSRFYDSPFYKITEDAIA